MSFLSRLDDSIVIKEREYKEVSPLKRAKAASSSADAKGESSSVAEGVERIGSSGDYDGRVDAKAAALLNYGSEQGAARRSILWKVSEFLFDLFDANLLDGYKKIENFENSCMECFIATLDSEEYTFSQEGMHKQFLLIFEGLIEEFLATQGCSVDTFYKEIDAYKDRMRSMASKRESALYDTAAGEKHVTRDYLSEANEIVDVIVFYYDFEKWVAVMKDRARHVLASRSRSDSKPSKPSVISTIEKAIINYCNR